jgi:hypothetical protein
MTHQLLKMNLGIQICEFIDLLQEFDLNSFKFGLILMRMIKDFVTRGVIALPLKKSHPKIYERRRR